MTKYIAAAALLVSFCSLLISVYFWRRSFRPIVSAAVKTHSAGSSAIIYDLVVLNSGSIPARNIRITANETAVTAALGMGATAENRERWLSGFKRTILLLQNGDRTSCSFGDTRASDTGFWKYEAIIPITITYEGWFDGWFERFFGKTHTETQEIQILDSESFTGNSWG